MFLLLEEKSSSIMAKATNHKPLEPSPILRKTNYLSQGNSATVVQKFCSKLFGGFCPWGDVDFQTENDSQEMLVWLCKRGTVASLFHHAKALKSCVQQNFNELILYFVFTPKWHKIFLLKTHHKRAFQPKAYATGNKRCPVRLFKKFKSHCPSEMNKVESPFFFSNKIQAAPDNLEKIKLENSSAPLQKTLGFLKYLE